MSKKTLITLGVIIILSGYVISAYNELVGLEENVDNTFSKIETQYQRRFDLIPNVVNTVKGIANFEQSTLQAVIEARSAWAKPNATVNEKIAAANSFDSALSRLLVTVESYPNLKATESFNNLVIELEGTENRIAFARNEYNDTATQYNKTVRTFPRNLITGLFNFDKEKELFEANKEAQKAPEVNFGTAQ